MRRVGDAMMSYMRPQVETAERLDRALGDLTGVEAMTESMFRWSRTIREALGMPVAELARRMGVSQPTATNHELNEERGAISVERLEALANALDCDLVYAFVPRTSLADRARRREAEMGQARDAKRKIPRY